MTQAQKLDRTRAAVLIMDFQNGIVNTAASDSQSVVQRAAQVLEAARAAEIPII